MSSEELNSRAPDAPNIVQSVRVTMSDFAFKYVKLKIPRLMALARFPALNSHAWLAATMPNSTGGVREDMTSASVCDAPEPLRLTTEGDISRSKQGHVQREQPMKGLALEPT